MFAEELTKIKESEAEAERILRQAKQDAKKALAEAEHKAVQIVEDAKTRGHEREKALVEEGESIAGKAYDETLERRRKECMGMAEQVRTREHEAIDLIIERIESKCQSLE